MTGRASVNRVHVWFPRGNDRVWGICRPSQAVDGRFVVSLGPVEFRIRLATQ